MIKNITKVLRDGIEGKMFAFHVADSYSVPKVTYIPQSLQTLLLNTEPGMTLRITVAQTLPFSRKMKKERKAKNISENHPKLSKLSLLLTLYLICIVSPMKGKVGEAVIKKAVFCGCCTATETSYPQNSLL